MPLQPPPDGSAIHVHRRRRIAGAPHETKRLCLGDFQKTLLYGAVCRIGPTPATSTQHDIFGSHALLIGRLEIPKGGGQGRLDAPRRPDQGAKTSTKAQTALEFFSKVVLQGWGGGSAGASGVAVTRDFASRRGRQGYRYLWGTGRLDRAAETSCKQAVRTGHRGRDQGPGAIERAPLSPSSLRQLEVPVNVRFRSASYAQERIEIS